MPPDPAMQARGRLGGLKTARKRAAHLTDAEFECLRELEQQANAYRQGVHGQPGAVASWLRIMADELEGPAVRTQEGLTLSREDVEHLLTYEPEADWPCDPSRYTEWRKQRRAIHDRFRAFLASGDAE